MQYFLLFLMGLLPTLTFAVSGGELSQDPKYAAIRAIFIKSTKKSGLCTATFITPNHLLTAAHCLNGKGRTADKFEYIGVYPFGYSSDVVAEGYNSIKVYFHPNYTEKGTAIGSVDLAIVEFSQFVSRDYINVSSRTLENNELVTLTGYGCDKATKQKNSQFKKASKKISEIKANNYFLKKSETSICQGDSGGPLLIETEKGIEVAGVNSYINPLAGIFSNSEERVVRLDAQSPEKIGEWIESVLQGRENFVRYSSYRKKR